MMDLFSERSFFTSPLRGEVTHRRVSDDEGEGVNRVASRRNIEIVSSPHPDALRASTLPLQGRVAPRDGERA